MAGVPVIQVLSRKNYEHQHLVPLPNALPLPPLSISSLRIKSTILSLTTNNLTYARVGHLLGWWGVHPLPSSIPAEFSDPEQYGRISAWGYGVVIESNACDTNGSPIEVGTQVFGYLPIGTLPVDMQIQVSASMDGQFVEVSKHRENVLPIYNRYRFYPPSVGSNKAEAKQDLGFDALFRVLFETGYLMSRFVFAWEPGHLIHPSTMDDGWTSDDAKLGTNSTVLMFSPSGKTALAFAYLLRHGRPTGTKPLTVIGIGSQSSHAFTEGTGLYDSVLDYDADSRDGQNLGSVLSLPDDAKVVILDFGSRGGAGDRWADALRKTHKLVQLRVGGEVVADSPERATQRFLASMQSSAGLSRQLNASVLRSQALDIMGSKRYFAEFEQEWDLCKKQGVVKGLRLIWGESMDDVGRGWERLCRGDVGPDEGLVFELN
ncbi:Uncharacterized protein BP5553_05467 [Venustampulla echinocandica]|uniref:Uncharacterized protein n=1 Tax=Venustampulla echinocandica TaxID=2656787 RepID=A0A370TRA2_9HELO|nr:Uncharacterized protein BP5553_05467 [Venustampulla echinocandica]RDL38034.1 Uncharacterized protein BP5553_05467 [Venustampulla echinocandica]